MSVELEKLAARVEALTLDQVTYWLSQKLEVEILAAIEPGHEAVGILTNKQCEGSHTTWEWTSGGVAWGRGSSWGTVAVPRCLTSLDAAMTLVPEGWSFSIGEKRGLPEHIRFFAWLQDHNTPDSISHRHTEGSAGSAALALTAAGLRARLQHGRGEGV